MKELTIDDLKIVTEFQHVPDDQIQWLIAQGETIKNVISRIANC